MSTLVFRVTVGSLYWHVRVFGTRIDLRTYEKSLGGKSPIRLKRKQYLAGAHVEMTLTDYRNGRARKRGKVGEILLSRQDLGVGTVTHECVHAAMAWARRLAVDLTERVDGRLLVPSGEERLAKAVDALVRQVYNRLYRKRVLVEAA